MSALLALAYELGLIPENLDGDECPRCPIGTLSMQDLHCRNENIWYVCSRSTNCGHRIALLDMIRGEQIWLARKSFRVQMKAYWLFCHRYNPEQVSELLGIDYSSSVMTLYRNYLDIVATQHEEANTNMEIGGNKVHCEADEVGFRCRPIWIGDEGFVEWLCYIAVVRRGSSKIFLEKLLHATRVAQVKEVVAHWPLKSSWRSSGLTVTHLCSPVAVSFTQTVPKLSVERVQCTGLRPVA